jgi:hypothetical protein
MRSLNQVPLVRCPTINPEPLALWSSKVQVVGSEVSHGRYASFTPFLRERDFGECSFHSAIELRLFALLRARATGAATRLGLSDDSVRTSERPRRAASRCGWLVIDEDSKQLGLARLKALGLPRL